DDVEVSAGEHRSGAVRVGEDAVPVDSVVLVLRYSVGPASARANGRRAERGAGAAPVRFDLGGRAVVALGGAVRVCVGLTEMHRSPRRPRGQTQAAIESATTAANHHPPGEQRAYGTEQHE